MPVLSRSRACSLLVVAAARPTWPPNRTCVHRGRDAVKTCRLFGMSDHLAAAQVPDRLLDAGEVAEILHVARSWVYEETRLGRMPHVRLGRYVRYRRAAIEAWVADLEGDGGVRRGSRRVAT